MKQATFYVSINRPTKIIYHALSTFRGILFVVCSSFLFLYTA